MPPEPEAWLLLAQGAYYLATGVWALIDIDSFQRATGPKTDLWLVKTVGVLVGVIGAALLAGAFRNPGGAELRLLSLGCALGLLGIDVVYVLKKRISAIYLADAAAEGALAGAWVLVRFLSPAAAS